MAKEYTQTSKKSLIQVAANLRSENDDDNFEEVIKKGKKKTFILNVEFQDKNIGSKKLVVSSDTTLADIK